jgi:hypothetical protein
MRRNWGIPTVTSGIASGGNHDPALRRADTLRDLNSLADHPPGRLHLAVVRDSSFFHERELDPIEELDAINNRCEFAACVMLSVFGISFGVLLAVGAALLDWSY